MPRRDTLADHFERLHANPPPSFNPAFDPTARARSDAVARAMEEEGFYDTHTRQECAEEYCRRMSLSS